MPLGRRTDYGDARYAGVEVDASDDVERELNVRRSQLAVLCVWPDLVVRRRRKLAASTS